jgi:hypothetical protein
MAPSPRVTVVVAVYNGGQYLDEAVRSVLEQTYRDFELLVVDDASDDGSGERVAATGDPRIRLLRNDRNIGQVPSLNRGLVEALGEYVARLDADDVMLPTRLERQVEVLDAEPSVALVGTWLDVVDEAGRRWATLRGHVGSYAEFVSAILANRIPFGHPSLMFRRDVVRDLGGYDPSLAPSEDKDLYRRLALARLEARVIPELLVRYRRHDMQLSQLQAERQIETDAAGQERFLTDLAPHLPARILRLLLAGDPAFWAAPPLGDLDSFLESTSERLRLTPAERAIVAGTIAERCARTLLAGWGVPSQGHAVRAVAPAAFVSAHGTLAARASLGLQPFLRATRPLGAAVGAGRLRARSALRNDRLQPIRAHARRVRLLRRLYVALLGFRLVDRDTET